MGKIKHHCILILFLLFLIGTHTDSNSEPAPNVIQWREDLTIEGRELSRIINIKAAYNENAGIIFV